MRIEVWPSHQAYLALCFLIVCSTSVLAKSNAFIRVNQIGYFVSDDKIAIAFSKSPLHGDFVLLDRALGRLGSATALCQRQPVKADSLFRFEDESMLSRIIKKPSTSPELEASPATSVQGDTRESQD